MQELLTRQRALGPLVRPHEGWYRAAGNWAREEETLTQFATVSKENGQLLGSLNTLGDDGKAGVTGKPYHSRDDRSVWSADALGKGAIDLQLGYG